MRGSYICIKPLPAGIGVRPATNKGFENIPELERLQDCLKEMLP